MVNVKREVRRPSKPVTDEMVPKKFSEVIISPYGQPDEAEPSSSNPASDHETAGNGQKPEGQGDGASLSESSRRTANTGEHGTPEGQGGPIGPGSAKLRPNRAKAQAGTASGTSTSGRSGSKAVRLTLSKTDAGTLRSLSDAKGISVDYLATVLAQRARNVFNARNASGDWSDLSQDIFHEKKSALVVLTQMSVTISDDSLLKLRQNANDPLNTVSDYSILTSAIRAMAASELPRLINDLN